MCTLSFAPQRDGYLLAMNRDESLDREAALAPQIFTSRDSVAVYPSESSGGTWLALNSRGMVLALLNRNGIAGVGELRSRGEIIPAFIHRASLADVATGLLTYPLAGLRPFTLVGVEPSTSSILEMVGDGGSLRVARHPWTARHWFSSSLSDSQAAAVRGETCSLFHRHFRVDAESLRELHRSHSPQRGPYALCVHRDGVGTVSYSEIHVDQQEASLAYAPGPPCERFRMSTLSLRRAPQFAAASGY